MGGGSILVPLLMFVFRLLIKEAIGTSLCIIVLTAFSGIVVHWKEKLFTNGLIDSRIVDTMLRS